MLRLDWVKVPRFGPHNFAAAFLFSLYISVQCIRLNGNVYIENFTIGFNSNEAYKINNKKEE
jgi:hypothetical protein